MTTWQARRAAYRGPRDIRDNHGQVGLGPKILCGFGQAAMGNFCDETIAWVDELSPGQIILPNGLTDAGTPGEYRMGADAARRIAAGHRTILRCRRNDPIYAGNLGYPQSARNVAPPVVIPCAKGHRSRIDESVLGRRQGPS